MAKAHRPADPRRTFFLLGTAALLIAALYWGQRIVFPFALAVLLTFVLAPVVQRLERRGLGRTPAVLVVVVAAFALLGTGLWALSSQVAELANDLPRYKAVLHDRVANLRGAREGGMLKTFQDFLSEVERVSRDGDDGGPPLVRVQPERPSVVAQLEGPGRHALALFGQAVSVILLVLCMLFTREDLRNRLIRLAGRGRLALTTRALDEAAQRIGRYLLGQSLINAGFGVAVGFGLWAIGVPYAGLWGALLAALRFVPSVGVWLVAPAPVGLTFLAYPEPTRALAAFGLILVAELATVNLVEPRVSGRSTGLAPVPLLLAVMFWTTLWGLVGLVLATPITVCLAVLGRHIPPLEFLAVLLGAGETLRPEARYYQRLLARDRHEAAAVLRAAKAEQPVAAVFDRVLLPALVLVRRGKRAGELLPDDEQFILQATAELVAEVFPDESAEAGGPPVVGLPARDEVDEVALRLVRHLARLAGQDLRLADGGPAGMLARLQQERPSGVIVAAVGPGGLTEARYLCRRLRAQLPEARIVVGRWGVGKEPNRARRALLTAGADVVAATLVDARRQLDQVAPPTAALHEAH
jgi:predicted PurR-regulated permease PerM